MEAAISESATVGISVPADIVERVDAIAALRHVGRDRAMVDLMRDAIAAWEERRSTFLELAERFQNSTDPAETERLREELAQ